MAAPDTMPWWLAISLSAVFTITYFIIRHRQNKKESK